MPKYVFVCTSCRAETSKYVPVSKETIECSICGSTMERQLPKIDTPVQVREIVDPYTNKRWTKDQEELLKERREQYYWEVEVPRLIEKYSLQTCLEEGWLTYNDKGELVINKPPSKR